MRHTPAASPVHRWLLGLVAPAALVAITLGTTAGFVRPPNCQEGPSLRIDAVDVLPARAAPGEPVTVRIRFGHALCERATYALGLSVLDPAGTWHDIPSETVVLDSAAAVSREMRWTVPSGPGVPGGPAVVVAALWDRRPEEAGAQRLAVERRAGALEVLAPADPVAAATGGRWQSRMQRLGRGVFDPANVQVGAGDFALGLRAGTQDGAQIFSMERYASGSYRALIQTPDAPGSISALFLYEDVLGDRNDEIDIEILNDGSRRALLSVWMDGRQVYLDEQVLPFDPSAGMYEYRIDFGPEEIRFVADGRVLRSWRGVRPMRPMRLMASTWWPVWLEGPPPAENRFMRFRPLEQ